MNKLMVPEKYIGIPFRDNGTDFNGADCVGLARMFVEDQLKIKVINPPSDIKKAQANSKKYLSLLENIPLEYLIPGDIPFFSFSDKWHCGVYVGYGKLLHIVRPLFKNEKAKSIISDIRPQWHKHYLGVIRTKNKKEIIVPEAGDLGTIGFIIGIISTVYSIVTALTTPKPKFGNDTGSPKYGFDAISNTISNELIYPIPFGRNKYGGNIIWYKTAGDTTERFVLLGIGKIHSISDVRVNDIPIADLPGCSYTAYLGTSDQNVDSRAAGAVKGLRNIAYLALTLKSSEKLPGGDPTVTCVAEGLEVKTWNGNIWTGENYSRNPAACLRKLLIIPREDGGLSVDESEINDAEFAEVYDYCAEMIDDGEGGTHARHQFDFVFDAEKPIHDAILEILQPYGMYLTVGEKIGLKILKEENLSSTFDMDNIKADSFKYYPASKNESYNQVIVKYSDPDQNDVGVDVTAIDQLDQVKSGDVRQGTFSFLGINRFAEASRRAEFIKNESNTNVIWCEFDTDINALHNTVGDVVSVTHDLPGWNGKPFRIIKITEESDYTRHVALKEETASIHNDGMSSVIETYDYGSPSNPYGPVTDVTDLQIAEGDYYLHKDGTVNSDILVSWTAPTDDSKRFLKYYQIELKKAAGEYEIIAIIGKAETNYTILSVEDEKAYHVRVKTISSDDVVSDGIESAELTIQGKLAPPADVVNFAQTFLNEIVFTWDKNSDKDLAGYEIRTEDANWGIQSSALVYRGLTNKYTIITPSSRTPGTFYIKAYDRSGNFSTTAQSVTPTNTAPSAPSIIAMQWFGFAKIEWNDVNDEDLKYYEVYKSPTNTWGGEEVLEIKVPGTAAIVQGNAPVDAKADAADAASITDADIASYGTDYFVGDVIIQTSGTYKGQEAIITAYDNSTGQVSVASWPSGTPSVGDEFVLKDRAYYKVRAVDTYGPGSFSSAVTINFSPLAEAEIGDAIISARKLIAGELITLSAQIKDAIITNAKVYDLDGSKITAETITLSKLASDAIPSKTYYQTSEPTSGMNEGDYWIDTDDSNKLYTYQNGSWDVVSESGGSSITVFRQDSIPTALKTGDLWIDTDDGDKMYRATNIGDNEITAGEWELIDAATATGWAYGSDTTKIDGGNIYTGSIVADSIATDTITADKYNQVRNTYVVNREDSLDSPHPFEIPFKIVSELVAIQSIKLSFKILNFRAYSTGAASGGGQTSSASGGATHRHGITIINNGYTNSVKLYQGKIGGNFVSSNFNTNTEGGHYHTFSVDSLGTNGIQLYTDGSKLFALKASATIVTSEVNGHTHTIDVIAVDSVSGLNAVGQSSGSLRDGGNGGGTVYTSSAPDPHTHTVANHVHPLSFGIYEDSQSPTVHYYVDNGSGYGAASAAYTSDQTDIDITSLISGSGWKRIKFDTNVRCRIAAIIECKLDISA